MQRVLLNVCRSYEHAPSELWPIVADLNGYAGHVTGLVSSDLRSEAGLGALRTCVTTKDQTWSESVISWQDGRSYEIEVDTATYPFPLKQLFRRFNATWTVSPVDAGSRVCISFVPDIRGGWLLWPLVKLGARQSRRDLEYTLRSYGDAVPGR